MEREKKKNNLTRNFERVEKVFTFFFFLSVFVVVDFSFSLYTECISAILLALWFRTTRKRDVGTGPFPRTAHSFVCSARALQNAH